MIVLEMLRFTPCRKYFRRVNESPATFSNLLEVCSEVSSVKKLRLVGLRLQQGCQTHVITTTSHDVS